MKRFGFATIVAATLVTSLSGAPRAQYDYFLTGNGTDAAGDTRFGIGLMGVAPTSTPSSRGWESAPAAGTSS
jgi:hypothetical protein